MYDDRKHGRGEWNVIHECARDTSDELHQQHGADLTLADREGGDERRELIGDGSEQAELGDALGEHKQAREKQQRVPLNFFERVLKLIVASCEKYCDRTENRNVRRFHVHHGVQKEKQNDKNQNRSAANEQVHVAYGILCAQFVDVDVDLLTKQCVTVVPLDKSKNKRHREQDPRTEDS